MSHRVITEGFGSFGTIGHVIRDGLDGSTTPPPAPEPEVVVVTGGKGDNQKRRTIVKPTGLPPYRERPKTSRRDERVEARVEETREIAEEIAKGLREEFTEVYKPPVITMSLREVEAEIGAILRKKLITEEDEILLLLLMAAAVAG